MSAAHASTAELLYRRLGRYAAQLNAVGNGGLAPASLDGSPVVKSRYVRIPVTFAKAALDRADRRIIGAPNGEQEITVNAASTLDRLHCACRIVASRHGAAGHKLMRQALG